MANPGFEKDADMGGVLYRLCTKCEKRFPKNSAHFHVQTRPSGKKAFSSYCKPCQRLATKKSRDRKRQELEDKYKKVTPAGIPILPF